MVGWCSQKQLYRTRQYTALAIEVQLAFSYQAVPRRGIVAYERACRLDLRNILLCVILDMNQFVKWQQATGNIERVQTEGMNSK